MKYHLAHPEEPPKARTYGKLLGLVAAVILLLAALTHLFRIDELLLIVSKATGNQTSAAWFVVIVILAEVFAIPFAVRMRLSRLANIVSGFMLTLAPLMWLLLTVWTYGQGVSIGEFSSFISTPAGTLLILLNLAWLTFNYVTLWALGYNQLYVFTIPRPRLKRRAK